MYARVLRRAKLVLARDDLVAATIGTLVGQDEAVEHADATHALLDPGVQGQIHPLGEHNTVLAVALQT